MAAEIAFGLPQHSSHWDLTGMESGGGLCGYVVNVELGNILHHQTSVDRGCNWERNTWHLFYISFS